MEYPTLNVKQKSRQMSDAFLGYNHNLRIGDSEFYDMKNMTSDYYPILAPRKQRGIYKDGVNATAIIGRDLVAEDPVVDAILTDEVCYVDGTAFVMNGERIELGLNDKPKQLISMGSYIIIMPDKKWVNTTGWILDSERHDPDEPYFLSGSCGDIDVENVSNGKVTFSLCTLDGEDYKNVASQGEPAKTNGALWYDTSTKPPVLKKYSESQKQWVSIPTTYVKIKGEINDDRGRIAENLNQYDGVEISGITLKGWTNLNGSQVIWGKPNDCEIIITGIPDAADLGAGPSEQTDPITVSRKMPDMDFVIEAGNRLWGCKYGFKNSTYTCVNEIYASKLGDFKNWNCYMGLSTDSYTASCGTDGPFTGAITHMGYPLFFKENFMHKVYGNYPANFQIQTTACRGVQNGSDKSLAIVNETLFYKSSNSVCAYDGSLPVEMSTALGDVRYSDAVACAYGNKYYIDMKTADGKYHLFVYDTAKGMWHKEDNIQVDGFCVYDGEVYAIEHGKNRIITMLGSGTKDDAKVPWMVETGLIGMSMPDMKYISKLLIRMSLEVGAEVDVSIQYDSMGDWEQVCEMTVTSLRSFHVPVRPRRCDHFRIRIEGEGEGRIYSITKTIEQGSDFS